MRGGRCRAGLQHRSFGIVAAGRSLFAAAAVIHAGSFIKREKATTMNNMVDQSESDYLKGNSKPLTTESSVLISSSKYLNSARLRDVVAQ
jgi:hypothetical protein